MDTGVLTGVLSCMLLRLSKDTQRSRRRREGVKVGGSRGKTQPYSSSPPPVHHPPIITPGWHPGSLRIVRGPRGATAHRRRANSLSLLRTDVSDVDSCAWGLLACPWDPSTLLHCVDLEAGCAPPRALCARSVPRCKKCPPETRTSGLDAEPQEFRRETTFLVKLVWILIISVFIMSVSDIGHIKKQ